MCRKLLVLSLLVIPLTACGKDIDSNTRLIPPPRQRQQSPTHTIQQLEADAWVNRCNEHLENTNALLNCLEGSRKNAN